MNINSIDGEQYCMNCDYWKSMNGRVSCINPIANCVWAPNQLNGCDYFHGHLEPKRDWSKSEKMGYRPSTFSKSDELKSVGSFNKN